MIQRFDHVPVVVRDLERARMFFALLCFAEDKAVVIKGPVMDAYMGVPGIEADHVTLVLRGVAPRLEVQLLRYRHPEPLADPDIERLEKVGSTTCVSRWTTSRPRWPGSGRTASPCATS